MTRTKTCYLNDAAAAEYIASVLQAAATNAPTPDIAAACLETAETQQYAAVVYRRTAATLPDNNADAVAAAERAHDLWFGAAAKISAEDAYSNAPLDYRNNNEKSE